MADSPSLSKPFDFTQFAQQVMSTAVSQPLPTSANATPALASGHQTVPYQSAGDVQQTDATQPDVSYTLNETHIHKGQLESSGIAMYSTDVGEHTGRLIAGNGTVVCYAMKNGMIRVIHVGMGKRTLLRTHTTSICDMDLHGTQLISTARDGQLNVHSFTWTEDASDATISSALDLQVKSEVPFTRVVRSPADPDKIVTVGGGVLALWSLNALKREAPSVSFAASQSKIILCQKDMVLLDVNWSCDGECIAVSCADGTVCLFKTQQAEQPRTFQPFGSGVPVGLARFLTAPSTGTPLLIVGSADNSELQLWHAGSDLRLLQRLHFRPQASFFNIAETVPSANLLLLANVRSSALFALSVAISESNGEPQFENLTEFDAGQAIVSLVATAGEGEFVANLFCLQQRAIQMLRLRQYWWLSDEEREKRIEEEASPELVVKKPATPAPVSTSAPATVPSTASPSVSSPAAKLSSAGSTASPIITPAMLSPAQLIVPAVTPITAAETAVAPPPAVTSPPLAQTTPVVSPSEPQTPPATILKPPTPTSQGQVKPITILARPSSAGTTSITSTTTSSRSVRSPTAVRPQVSSSPPRVSSGTTTPVSEVTTPAISAPSPAPATAKVANEKPTPSTETAPAVATTTTASTTAGAKKQDVANVIQQNLRQFEAAMAKRMSKMFQQQLDAHAQKLEKERHVREKAESERQDKIVAALTQAVREAVDKQFARQVKPELPKMISAAVQRPVQDSLRACFQDMLLPGFERAMQATLSQLSGAVDAGLTQHVHKPVTQSLADLHSALLSEMTSKVAQQVTDSVTQSLSATLSQSLSQATEGMAQRLSMQLQSQARSAPPPPPGPQPMMHPPPMNTGPQPIHSGSQPMMHPMHPSAQPNVPRSMPMSSALAALGVNVTPSPAPRPQPQPPQQQQQPPAPQPTASHPPPASPAQQQIDQALILRQHEDAFTKALSASSLDLVVWLCSRADYRWLSDFKQAVILSLIQQLGVDLTADAELKLDWLREALLCVDPSDQVVTMYGRQVLGALMESLEKHGPALQSNSNTASSYALTKQVASQMLSSIS